MVRENWTGCGAPRDEKAGQIGFQGEGCIGRPGGGAVPLRQTGDMRHRSGQPIHQLRVHGCACEPPGSRSTWMARGAGWTMSLASGCGGPSNNSAPDRTISRPAHNCAQAWAAGSIMTITIASIGPLRAKPQPRPMAKSEFQIRWSKPTCSENQTGSIPPGWGAYLGRQSAGAVFKLLPWLNPAA